MYIYIGARDRRREGSGNLQRGEWAIPSPQK